MNKCTVAVFLTATILAGIFTRVVLFTLNEQAEIVQKTMAEASVERVNANKAILDAAIAKQAYEDAKKMLPKCVP